MAKLIEWGWRFFFFFLIDTRLIQLVIVWYNNLEVKLGTLGTIH